MNFYYDPILGVQYKQINYFIIDIDALPTILDCSIEEVLKQMSQTGIQFTNIEGIQPVEQFLKITMEYL